MSTENTTTQAPPPSIAPSKAPSIASQRRERSETPPQSTQDPKEAAAATFEEEDQVMAQFKLEYEAHLRRLRVAQLRREMEMLDAETPRLVAAIHDTNYANIIEDRALADQMQDDAQKQADAYILKFRTARGLGNLAKDTAATVRATEESLQKYGKMMRSVYSVAKDTVKLAGESADAAPRITFLTKVQPQWHLVYELLYARAKQWLYSVHLYQLLVAAAQLVSKSATATRVRQEVNALDVDMTDDDDDDEAEASDDGDTEESLDDD